MVWQYIRTKKRCSRLKNIIIYRVEEPENNIHHDQEGSCWSNFTNFFKNVKYTILGVTVKATIVWAVVYVIAIIITYVGDSYESSCEEGKFYQRALLLFATGTKTANENKQSQVPLSPVPYLIYARSSIIIVSWSLGK